MMRADESFFGMPQVCGLCPDGWAMTSTGCTSCPVESELAPYRNAAIGIFVAGCFVIWFVISWKPLLSSEVQKELDKKGKRISKLTERIQNLTAKIKSWQQKIKKYSKKINGLLSKDVRSQLKSLTKDRITQYLKLYISFFQVVSSFLTFHVKWPSLLLSAMSWIKGTLFLDIVQLPGLSCLWAGVNFQQRLFTYTLGPLAVVGAFLVPIAFAWAAGYRKTRAYNWEAVSDAAWRNVMFWIFLVYPIVSLTTLQAFDCQPADLGQLAADFSQPCPTNDSLLRIWSFAFILVYPIGIPLFCFVSMVSMGVHLAARDKVEFNILSAIVAKYTQSTTSIESQRIASLFTATGQENDETKLEMNELWSTVTDGQGNWREEAMGNIKVKGMDSHHAITLLQNCARDRKVLTAEQFCVIMSMEQQVQKVYNVFFDSTGNLRNVTRQDADVKLAGIDPMSIQRFVQTYDQDGDGNISLEEFRDMVNDVVQKSSMFTGVEGDRLTAEQAVALLTFDWKPKGGNLAQLEGACGRTEFAIGGDDEDDKDPISDNGKEEGENSKTKYLSDEIKQDTENSKTEFERMQGLAKYAEHLEKGITKLVKRRKNQNSEVNKAEVEEKEEEEAEDREETKEQMRLRLLQECKTDRNVIAAQIWQLGKRLLKHKVISVPDLTWTKSFSDTYIPAVQTNEMSIGKEILDDFVIHPDVEDDFRISSFERFLASGNFKVPEDWKTVRNRKVLERKAISRIGFVFVAYKVNFWFWEMIEMLRK
jgi:hypothetical protein